MQGKFMEKDFESWLRSICFQKPTKEAYDLAKAAWIEAKKLYTEKKINHVKE